LTGTFIAQGKESASRTIGWRGREDPEIPSDGHGDNQARLLRDFSTREEKSLPSRPHMAEIEIIKVHWREGTMSWAHTIISAGRAYAVKEGWARAIRSGPSKDSGPVWPLFFFSFFCSFFSILFQIPTPFQIHV
jgi:hypothetical protein